MAFTADAIANALLDVAKRNGEKLTPMKLQKLAYFSHGWFLAIEGKPFVNEPIYAWKFGPVIQSIYHEFKGFGESEIDRNAREVRFKNGSVDYYEPQFETEPGAGIQAAFGRALVDRMWDLYGHRSAIQLSNATHAKGTPWRQIHDRFCGSIPLGVKIPDDMIRTYFADHLKK